MRILFLGDSITQGVGASAPETNYVSLVGKKLGCEAINYGIGGTRIGAQKRISSSTVWDLYFRLRLEIMPNEADLVFVFGGTNDYGHGNLHLGDAKAREAETFAGELDLLIQSLIKKYGKEKLCFILPLRRFSEEGVYCKGEDGKEVGAPLCDYVKCMRAILSDYGIDCIDLYEKGFPKPEVNTGDEYTVDGLHPNDKGYELIAERVCEYINNRK